MADNDGILSIFECPVCFEYMEPPIYQCLNQHLICSYCESKQDKCPICRKKLNGSRNLCMEKVAEYIPYPCKFQTSGCDTKIFLHEKKNHEKTCLQNGKMFCSLPMEDVNMSTCLWTGSYEEHSDHIRHIHSQLINNSPDGYFTCDSADLTNYYLLFDDNIFQFLLQRDILRTSSIRKVYTYFFHVVSTCVEEKYAYNVRIQGKDDAFEGFVGKMISHINIKDMASKNECHYFMGNDEIFKFEGNIVKIT